jgi:hypothetical protein
VGLLVVHGIGRQRGAEAAETLARHLGDEPPEDVSKASGSSRFQVRVGGIPVLVREASWADRSDLANPPSILDASALLKQLRDSFLEVGRRILKGTPASGRKLLSLLVLTSLALNLAAVTVMIVVAFVAPTRGTDAPPSAPGPRDPLALGVGFTIFLLALCGGYVAAMRVLGDGRERHRKWRLSRPVLSIAAFGFGFLGTLFISTLLSVLLTYLVWFALIAAGINLAARPLVRPLRWLGGAAVAGHGWRLVRALGTFLNLASNLMIVLPVHALLQATKAYVNLFSVVLLGGGEARRALPADSNGPRWTRAKAIAWGLATTLGVIVLLLVCEIVLYPVWLPLVLSSDSSAASLGEAWFAVVIGWGLLMWALRVPLDWLFDVSNYQVGSQRDRDRLFFGVLGEAVEDLRSHGCTEVHLAPGGTTGRGATRFPAPSAVTRGWRIAGSRASAPGS